MELLKRVGISIGLVVAATLAVTPVHARTFETAEEPAPAIEGRGFWSLDRLGYGEQLLTADDLRPGFGPSITVAVRGLPFRLPAGARQGPRDWYLVKLHYRLEIDEETKPGLITVSSSSNGRTMAALDFRVLEPGSLPLVRGTSVGLVGGSRLRQGRKVVWEGNFTNYFQISGVRPGPSVLTFAVAQQDGAEIRSLRVFADSGILVTPNGPSAVTLVPSLRDRDIRVGERFRIGFTVRSIGEGAVADGSKVVISAGKLRVLGPRSIELERIPVGRAESGSFALMASRDGTFPVTIRYRAWNGDEVVRLAARVTANGQAAPSGDESAAEPLTSGDATPERNSGNASLGWVGGAAVAGVAVAMLAVALVFARRRRRSTPTG